mmetsp:Transcript_11713/g.34122  ORF Transcript_11713/g.34122 Transcript_11713/m.34122 type:complete len:253 (+) Transcript_11713:605-1363(+)
MVLMVPPSRRPRSDVSTATPRPSVTSPPQHTWLMSPPRAPRRTSHPSPPTCTSSGLCCSSWRPTGPSWSACRSCQGTPYLSTSTACNRWYLTSCCLTASVCMGSGQWWATSWGPQVPLIRVQSGSGGSRGVMAKMRTTMLIRRKVRTMLRLTRMSRLPPKTSPLCRRLTQRRPVAWSRWCCPCQGRQCGTPPSWRASIGEWSRKSWGWTWKTSRRLRICGEICLAVIDTSASSPETSSGSTCLRWVTRPSPC